MLASAAATRRRKRVATHSTARACAANTRSRSVTCNGILLFSERGATGLCVRPGASHHTLSGALQLLATAWHAKSRTLAQRPPPPPPRPWCAAQRRAGAPWCEPADGAVRAQLLAPKTPSRIEQLASKRAWQPAHACQLRISGAGGCLLAVALAIGRGQHRGARAACCTLLLPGRVSGLGALGRSGLRLRASGPYLARAWGLARACALNRSNALTAACAGTPAAQDKLHAPPARAGAAVTHAAASRPAKFINNRTGACTGPRQRVACARHSC